MLCPYCGFLEDKVIDSRPTDEGSTIRRRRECLGCAKRFTTYEKIERLPLMIIKKNNTFQPFDRNKILSGLIKASEKRPISMKTLEQVVQEVENDLYNSMRREIPVDEIGELVMKKLKLIDDIAYVRFASVYREFKDINTFFDELKEILRK